MKKLFTIMALCVAFAACTDKPKETTNLFGKAFDPKDAIPVANLITEMGNSPTLETKVTGKILEVCKEMGCWVVLDLGNGETMRVDFHDKDFRLPVESEGKMVTVLGTAKVDVTSVEDQKHYMADAGKPQSEIDAITEPKNELTMEAEGLILN